jgi:hypothetical protein
MKSGTKIDQAASVASRRASLQCVHRNCHTAETMSDSQHAVLADPFAMLIDPAAVLQAIERSGRLGALASRICRPLDKPLIPKRDDESARGAEDTMDAADDSVVTRY